MDHALERLNALAAEEAQKALLACCGSTNWARQVAAARPFRKREHLFETAEQIWWNLGREDWLEAFRAHPRIGEQAKAGGEPARRWSAQEQVGTRGVARETQQALQAGNRAYEERFGYLFIVCATGKSSEEMLALLRQRLQNDPDTELRVAAEEQQRITRLRLEKLLQS